MKHTIQILHITQVAGRSKKTGNDYDMRMAQCIVHKINRATNSRWRSGDYWRPGRHPLVYGAQWIFIPATLLGRWHVFRLAYGLGADPERPRGFRAQLAAWNSLDSTSGPQGGQNLLGIWNRLWMLG